MTRPDDATLRGAIALATRAPSVHNTQPWRWLIGGDSLHLLADWTRQAHATDPDGRDLLISCGAALHHLRVALAAFGWHAHVAHLPNTDDPDHLAAIELTPSTPTDDDITLASAITVRQTDRRGFSSWPVPEGYLDQLVAGAAHAGGLLVPVTEPGDLARLARAFALGSLRQETDPAYAGDMAVWSGRRLGSDDGVLAASAPAGATAHGDARMRTFRGGTLPPVAADAGPDAGRLLVLATTGDDPMSRLRAGEAASAALLTATTLHLASCLLSQPIEITDIRRMIGDQVLDDAAVPQLVIRVGWTPVAAGALPRTARRPLEQVLHYLPGAGPRRAR